jgi:hypothetical protein
MRTILILLSVFVIQSTSFAQSYYDDSAEIQAAIDARNSFVNALLNKDYMSFAHQGFDIAVNQLADQLRTENNDPVMADELLANWSRSSVNFSRALTMSALELGDHSPLFPWVNQFLGKMSNKYGTIIYTLPIVKDIMMVNYALPVVFAPRGAWQTDGQVEEVDNRIEYRKHFIPFANFVTYYTALIACNYVAQRQGQPDLKKVCKPAAQKLQFVMGRYIAAPVSDWIFNAANQSMQIGADRLKYNNVDELRRAIQN